LIFLFLRKPITTELFSLIRLHILLSVNNNINFIFVDAKDINFFGFIKTTKLDFFPCFSVPFDFCVLVKIYNKIVIFTYWTSFFVVLWKTIQLLFFSMQKTLIFVVSLKQQNVYFFEVLHFILIFVFLWQLITTQFFFHILHFIFCDFVQNNSNYVFSMFSFSFFVVLRKQKKFVFSMYYISIRFFLSFFYGYFSNRVSSTY